MGVSRSGYYKWLKREPSETVLQRKEVIEIVDKIHEEHPTHGYRWVAAFILLNYYLKLSDNYIYKCFRYLGIRAQSKHQSHYTRREEKDKFPNHIYSTWDMVDRPRQVIVSDMTVLKWKSFYYEITFYFDVFTKEILTWHIGTRRGDREQYIEGLEDIVKLLDGTTEPAIIHTDQGSVYASKAYNELIKDTNIIRSMSRAGKPTDNPVNEALNGWIKEELMIDFRLGNYDSMTREALQVIVNQYVDYYNNNRPCYAIGYDAPARYYSRFCAGEIERKNTFEHRVLTTEPKFVQQRRLLAHSQDAAVKQI